MRELTPEILQESVELINRLRSHTLSEAQISATVLRLKKLLPDPHFMAYTVNRIPQLNAEEIVRKAFEYRPFLMAAPWPQAPQDHLEIAATVAYACIFEITADNAAQHILKLISQKVGFKHEPEFCRQKFSEMLETYPLGDLSRFGARFNASEWRCIFESVVKDMEAPEGKHS